MRHALLPAAAAALLIVSIPGVGAQSPPGPMVFAGSGSNLPITRRLVDAFGRARPDVAIHVPASIGSTGGIQAAADGAIALALISRPLREPEKTRGLVVMPYARTAVVIGAHPTVAADGIRSDELVRIYNGMMTCWANGREIVVLTREPGDSSIEVVEQKIPGFRDAYAESHRARRWAILFSDHEMHRVLAKTPSAIGLLDSGAITAERLPIKPLKIDGVAPTPENVRAGRYPLVKTLSLAFRPDRLPAGARAFLDFVRSSEGKKILTAHGYLPPD